MKCMKNYLMVTLFVLCTFANAGAVSVTVFHGVVRSLKGSEMNIMLRNGSERQVQLTKDTRVFLSGDLSPYSFIKRNSKVEVAVSSDGKCLQVVVQEGPK